MNLKLDTSVFTRVLHALLGELRQKRLWPVAVLLLAGLVAIPVLLSKSPKATPQAQVPATVAPPSSGTTLPAISVSSTPAHTDLKGHARNPFGAAAGSGGTSNGATTGATSVVSTVTASQNAVSTVNNSSASTTTGGSSSTGSSTAPSTVTATPPPSSPPSITGNAKPKPVQSGLKSTQAYDVALSLTNPQNGVDTVDPLARLSVVPNNQQPRLVELGVEQGGSRVLFAVQPGAVVAGPGTCIPGPLDCEILSLAQDQTEAVSQSSAGAPDALFAVTGISVTRYSSASAASKARRAGSAAGRALIDKSTLPALSLFKYEPSLGSIVDLRNLKVGG